MSDEATPPTVDEVHEMMQRLAAVVMDLGRVDFTALIHEDETPATASVRATSLCLAIGMLGSLVPNAMMPVDDVLRGMVAAALAGAESTQPGSEPG